MSRTYLFSILCVLLLATGIVMALVHTKPQQAAEVSPPPPQVSSVRVVRGDLQPSTLVKGQLQPAQRAWLRFETAGRVVQRHVEPGDHAPTGTVLLRIEDGDLRDALTRTRARLERERAVAERDRRLLKLTRAQVELQQRENERLAELREDALTSQASYDDAARRLLGLQAELERLRHAVQTADSRLEELQAEVSRAARELQRAELKAPFDGTVNRVRLEVGDYANPNMEVVEWVRIDALDLHLEITGEQAAVLRRGDRVPVQFGEVAGAGEVIALETVPDADTHTHAVRIRLGAEGPFSAGRIVSARLSGRALRGVLLVPNTAVLRAEEESYVFRIGADARLRRTPVNVLYTDRDRLAISGLAEGEHVVADDVGLLADGQQVRVEP